ncbi:uncharacterized protein MYCFIDRAFT_172125 [Pseudocercospora fijiensis CIRAD86]|uniref:Uncharacterized protein n=1 Tax=Pseudocercospora fijiensis (strain CIRAD86) TaxID=383855 RepID=M3A5F4_PSEFD|nr:uncharacterized protein MYCFIDRAFT_172125 [Pseudocercospora fijiensis CIRAD86]EME86354.1 hypothetical protein MYCFIDRAFT_172125 [Pseudocercospora fijiensis CIRAD86]
MAIDAPNFRTFPNLGRSPKIKEEEDLTSAAPSQDGESAPTLPTGTKNDGAQEERHSPAEEQESRGADPALAGDLFDIPPTLMEDNALFGTLGRNQVAKLFEHEEMLRMASQYTIAKMAEMYQAKYGQKIKNKRISVRLDTAKDKVAAARGCLRKDIVAAFEEKKREYGVEKAKNMEAGRKRKALKQAAAAANKKRKTSSITIPLPKDEEDEDSDVDDFAALEERLLEYSDEEGAEMTRKEKRGELQVKPCAAKKGGRMKRKNSRMPIPEDDEEESLPEYSDEEMAEMERKQRSGEVKVKEKLAEDSKDEERQSISRPMPAHLRAGAVERGQYTEEHAADALMMLSREVRKAQTQPEHDDVTARSEGDEDEEGHEDSRYPG